LGILLVPTIITSSIPDVGALYEEAILHSRQKARLLLLSDSIPNARQLAEWVAHIQEEPCHCITLDSKPVPLYHYVYTHGAKGLVAVAKGMERFAEAAFSRALEEQRKAVAEKKAEEEKGRRISNGVSHGTNSTPTILPDDTYSHAQKALRTMRETGKTPCIVFAADEQACDKLASTLWHMDFMASGSNTEKEKIVVEAIFENAVANLSEADKKLNQVGCLTACLLWFLGVKSIGAPVGGVRVGALKFQKFATKSPYEF